MLKGGLKVLYLQGPNFTWEIKYLARGLDAAKEIHVELAVSASRPSASAGSSTTSSSPPVITTSIILGDIAADT